MSLYAIGDLHLGFKVEKPMDIFGDNWTSHENTIKKNWLEKITEEDTVIIPGDISWATKYEDAKADLDWINELPGKKIILKGNHDYWWQSMAKMRNEYEKISFLHNNFYTYDNYAICGTRGWLCPNEYEFSEHDEKIYKREALRLTMSLDQAKKAGYDKFIVILHYPPTNDQMNPSLFTEIIEQYQVEKVIFGHLHSYGAADYKYKGLQNNIEYFLTSADYIKFDPVKII